MKNVLLFTNLISHNFILVYAAPAARSHTNMYKCNVVGWGNASSQLLVLYRCLMLGVVNK